MQRNAVVTPSFLWLTVIINYFISESVAQAHFPIHVRRIALLINLTLTDKSGKHSMELKKTILIMQINIFVWQPKCSDFSKNQQKLWKSKISLFYAVSWTVSFELPTI